MLIPVALALLGLSAAPLPDEAAATTPVSTAQEASFDANAPHGVSTLGPVFAAKGGRKKKSWILKRPAMPQGSVFGIGAQVGYPTALTLKFMLLDAHGLNIGIGAGHGFAHYRPVIGAHVDYNYHLLDLVNTDTLGLTFYFGIGGSMGIDLLDIFDGRSGLGYTGRYYGVGYWPFPSYGTRLAARFPVGLSFTLEEVPLEFFGEVVPTALIFPGFGLGLGGSLGVRFWL